MDGSARQVGDAQTLDWELLRYKWKPPKADRVNRTMSLSRRKGRKRTLQATDQSVDREDELGRDYLTRCPQEVLDNIFSYLDEPVDCICVKVSCRTLYWAIRPPLKLLQNLSSTAVEVFRTRCALENPKGDKLQCAMCLQRHPRGVFSKKMLEQSDGTRRYCLKARREGVLEFGLSALTFDTIRHYLSNANDANENGYIDCKSFSSEEWNIYPRSTVAPEMQFPLRHTLKNIKFAKTPGMTTIGPDLRDFNVGVVYVDQRLKFREGHVNLKTYLEIPSRYRDLIVEHSVSIDDTRIMVRAHEDPIWWCPHASSLDNPVICNVAWAGATRIDRSYLFAQCVLCETSMKAYTDASNNMIIRIKRDLGPMTDEQDHLWLRHVSNRTYKKPYVRIVEELGRRHGDAAWWYKNDFPVEDLIRPPKRRSLRQRGLPPSARDHTEADEEKRYVPQGGLDGRAQEQGQALQLTAPLPQGSPQESQMSSIVELMRHGYNVCMAIMTTMLFGDSGP